MGILSKYRQQIPDSLLMLRLGAKTGNSFIKTVKEDKAYVVYIQKGSSQIQAKETKTLNASTMVVFSGDLDKAIASMIIANGAAAMGKDVTLFFTFWGLKYFTQT